jgi:hypothetical protein
MLPRNKSPLEQLQEGARQAAYEAIIQMFSEKLDNESLLEFAQGAAMEYIESATGKNAAADHSIINLVSVTGKEALGKFLASELRKFPSEARAKASRENGKSGGRPKKKAR